MKFFLTLILHEKQDRKLALSEKVSIIKANSQERSNRLGKGELNHAMSNLSKKSSDDSSPNDDEWPKNED